MILGDRSSSPVFSRPLKKKISNVRLSKFEPFNKIQIIIEYLLCAKYHQEDTGDTMMS